MLIPNGFSTHKIDKQLRAVSVAMNSLSEKKGMGGKGDRE